MDETNENQMLIDLPVPDSLPALRHCFAVQDRYVAQAMQYLLKQYGNPALTIGWIADALCISEGHLSHMFRQKTGYTLIDCLSQLRISMAMKLLSDPSEPQKKIFEIAQAVGFRDMSYFSGCFKKRIGCTPVEYRNRLR